MSNIKQVIEALFQKTVENGCTPEEQAAALGKASELMAKYAIDSSAFEETPEPMAFLYTQDVADSPWVRRLLNVVGITFSVATVRDSRKERISYNFYGEKASVEMARAVFLQMVARAHDLGKQEFKKLYGTTSHSGYAAWMLSFKTGFSTAMYQAIKQKREYASLNGNALAVIKQKMNAAVAYRDSVETGKIYSRRSRHIPVDDDAFNAGRAAGSNYQTVKMIA